MDLTDLMATLEGIERLNTKEVILSWIEAIVEVVKSVLAVLTNQIRQEALNYVIQFIHWGLARPN